MFRLTASLFALAMSTAFAPFAQAETPAQNGVVNVYSARHYDTDLSLYDRFKEETGITVNLIEGNSDELIARIEREGKNSPADMLITVDAGRLWRAEEAGIFSPVSSRILEERIPAHLRHPDGLWFGLSKRARIIIYNKAAGRPEKLETYADLADPSNTGRICMRSSSNIYNVSLLASIIEHEGAEKAEEWAKGVVANFAMPPQGNDTANVRSVASGECGISVVNTYYLGRMLASDDPEIREAAEKVGIVFPNQQDRGTHVNLSGAGVLKHAPNRENAIKFIEFLTSDWAQLAFTQMNHEYTAVPGVSEESPVRGTGAFKEDEVNANVLGRNQAEAVRIFDRAGWK